MAPKDRGNLEVERLAASLVAEVAATMGDGLTEMGRKLHAELADSIPELRGDPLILELLRASTESNVETFLHVAQYDIAIDDVTAPSAAVEYARRLAQRGISSNALLRAYRLGQRRVTDWALTEIARAGQDGQVAFAAARMFGERTFAYVDRVAEQVVAEYESERERWLANRNTVRATMLATMLDGAEVDLGSAENALGYRLRQQHLGVVAWAAAGDPSTKDLRSLEAVVSAIAEAVGAVGQPLFIAQDGSLGWGWIPLGRSSGDIDLEGVPALVENAGPTVRVALGTPAAAVPGFRSSHREALRAHSVAVVAGDRAGRVTTYAEPGVRAATLLAADLEFTRELVSTSLGGLATDDEASERLRETLLTFLTERSYLATAEVLHMHKNTVKYRVDKALEARGRGMDDDAFTLELALLACRWLGPAVLSR